MDIKDLQSHWDLFGKVDPFWAILTVDSDKGEWDVKEFFKTGEKEISLVMDYLDRLGLPPGRERVLDFGCGVGRLTQSLADHFSFAFGVDIAPSMIEQARGYNRHRGRCQYILNDQPGLGLFPASMFDLIYSNIVLQHMEPQYSKMYIREFIRTLAPDGVAVFQVPSHLRPKPPPPDGQALPPEAFRAEIKAADSSGLVLAAGQRFMLRVTVKNTSGITWPAAETSAHFALSLGNHWLDSEGNIILIDDGREPLRDRVPPGGQFTFDLYTTALARPGDYILEFDMVQEGVAWFKNRGSPTERVRVRLEDRPRAKRREPGPAVEQILLPKMEMYGTPREEIAKLVEESNGRIVDVQDDRSAGPAWVSFRYCVAKKR